MSAHRSENSGYAYVTDAGGISCCSMRSWDTLLDTETRTRCETTSTTPSVVLTGSVTNVLCLSKQTKLLQPISSNITTIFTLKIKQCTCNTHTDHLLACRATTQPVTSVVLITFASVVQCHLSFILHSWLINWLT